MSAIAPVINNSQNPLLDGLGRASLALKDILGRDKNFSDAFAKSFRDSAVMLPIYVALSLPIEYLTNKGIKPLISKVYKQIKGDEAVDIPEVQQSIFSGIKLFAWFPALFLADTARRMLNYYGEVVEPKCSDMLLSGIATSLHNQEKYKNIALDEDVSANPVAGILNIVAGKGENSKVAEKLEKAANSLADATYKLENTNDNRQIATAISESISGFGDVMQGVLDKSAHCEQLMKALVEHGEKRTGRLLEMVKPQSESGFIGTVMKGDFSRPEDVQASLTLLYALVQSDNGIEPLTTNNRWNKAEFTTNLYNTIRSHDGVLLNADIPEMQRYQAWGQIAAEGIKQALAAGQATCQGFGTGNLEHMFNQIDYARLHHSINPTKNAGKSASSGVG